MLSIFKPRFFIKLHLLKKPPTKIRMLKVSSTTDTQGSTKVSATKVAETKRNSFVYFQVTKWSLPIEFMNCSSNKFIVPLSVMSYFSFVRSAKMNCQVKLCIQNLTMAVWVWRWMNTWINYQVCLWCKNEINSRWRIL